ncbi:hypothetical protein J4434_07480 [Candidatus Woesearchaeota archaeon]|nr:hypothetical protein [Candidatus Woesearchaeota archaeon]
MEAQFDNEDKEWWNEIRKGKITRIVANSLGRVVINLTLLMRPIFWLDKEFRDIFFDYRKRVGLLEGAIFDNTLYMPNEKGDSLEYLTSVGGRWSSYDHTSRSILGIENLTNHITDAKLFAFPLPETLDKSVNDYTSIGTIDPVDFTDLIQIVCPTIEELLKWGFVERVTYSHAFSKIGIYERYETNLYLLGVADKLIYQVTPKGNGLIYLDRDSGEKEPKKMPFGVKVPSWAST